MSIINSKRIFLNQCFGPAEAAVVEHLLGDVGGELTGSAEGRYWKLAKNQLIITINVQPIESRLADCKEALLALGLLPEEVREVVTVQGLNESAELCRLISDRLAAELEGITGVAEQCS